MTTREARRSRVLANALALVALTLVWLLLWGRLSWGTLALAVVVAVLVLAVFPLPLPRSALRPRLFAALVVLFRFLADLVLASVHVAWLAIRPRRIGTGRILDVPLHSQDDLCCTIVAEMTSLVPGTVVIDLDAQTRILTLHVLDNCDDERARHEIAEVHALERRVEHALGLDRRVGR